MIQYSSAASRAERAEFVPFFHELIRTAFDVIRPLFLSGTAVITKSDATPVTLADRGAEEAMRALIERRYPSHGILGEEFGETLAAVAADSSRYRWVLDPVDGTKSFIGNCFLFGTLIALERDDGTGFRPLIGTIAHPAASVALIGCSDETRLYGADGSERIARVRPCARLEDATLLVTTHWEHNDQRGEPAPGTAAMGSIIRQAKMYRTWGDCFGYFALATGGADVMLDPTLSYWDIAAIVPVIEGAGGRVTSWFGGDPLAEPSAIASAGPLHPGLLRLLHG